jgi:hypothetical protein
MYERDVVSERTVSSWFCRASVRSLVGFAVPLYVATSLVV